jgi:hypothetical protein
MRIKGNWNIFSRKGEHLMFIQIILLLSLMFISTPALAKSLVATCPSPKFLSLRYEGDICDTLNAKQDSDLILFSIDMQRPPLNSENDPSQQALLKTHTHDLFTKYTIYNTQATMRLPVPADSQIDYSYSLVWMSKHTALLMVQEDYIGRLVYQKIPTTGIRHSSTPIRWAPGTVEKWFDASGKNKDGISHGHNFQKHFQKE